MSLWYLAVLPYLLVALFAWAMCTSEERRMGGANVLRRGLSLLACIAWPATLVIMILAVRLQAPRPLQDGFDDSADLHGGLGQWREA